jgi:YfiR/HmsC-like
MRFLKPGSHGARTRWAGLNRVLWLAAMLLLAGSARASDLPEYRLKAAFVYNFLTFTEWPASTDGTLNLCIHGKDPFGPEIDGLQGKVAAGRSIAVHRKAAGESLKNCQAVFIAASMIDSLPQVLEALKGQPVLTLADSPGAMRRGVALNMGVVQGRVTFAANLQAARSAGLNLSSKLLRLATEVAQ